MLRVSTAGPLLRLVERLPRVRRIAEPVAPNVMELLDLYRNNISIVQLDTCIINMINSD